PAQDALGGVIRVDPAEVDDPSRAITNRLEHHEAVDRGLLRGAEAGLARAERGFLLRKRLFGLFAAGDVDTDAGEAATFSRGKSTAACKHPARHPVDEGDAELGLEIAAL